MYHIILAGPMSKHTMYTQCIHNVYTMYTQHVLATVAFFGDDCASDFLEVSDVFSISYTMTIVHNIIIEYKLLAAVVAVSPIS